MKTFEERYTAWIDNELEGPALTSFELELSRRASAGEARADKEDAARLHHLLVIHLKAPAMTNTEFFSHQLRGRIDVESNSGRRREEKRHARGSLFTWPFARLASLGAACLFVATALFYGMMPPHAATPSVAVVAPANQTNPAVVSPATVPDAVAVNTPAPRPSDGTLALLSTPSPVDLNAEIQVVKVPASSSNTTATPLQYKDANVLWINGLDYMPTVPGESPSSPAPVPASSANP